MGVIVSGAGRPALNPLGRLIAYAGADDPATATANVVALAVGCNGPIYPLYVIAVTGWHQGEGAWLTMAAAPLFCLVPALARRSSTAARAALPLLGTAHTLWSTKVMGAATGVGLFLLPCILLAALLHRPEERLWRWLAIGLPAVSVFLPADALGAPLMALTPELARRLVSLDTGCVALLSGLLALRFAAVIGPGRGA
jgi:hypothetical protein